MCRVSSIRSSSDPQQLAEFPLSPRLIATVLAPNHNNSTQLRATLIEQSESTQRTLREYSQNTQNTLRVKDNDKDKDKDNRGSGGRVHLWARRSRVCCQTAQCSRFTAVAHPRSLLHPKSYLVQNFLENLFSEGSYQLYLNLTVHMLSWANLLPKYNDNGN